MPESGGQRSDTGLTSKVTALATGLERGSVSLREWGRRHSRPLAAVALVVFVALSVVAVREYSRLDLHPDLWLVIPAAVFGTLAMATLNAAEYTCSALIAHHRPSVREAVTVSVAGSAANLLPVPGAILVRNYAMLSGGATLAAAVGGTVATAMAWLGMTAFVVGLIVVTVDVALGVPLAIAGAALFGAATVIVRRRLRDGSARSVVLAMLVIELLTVGVEIGRYWLLLEAIGIHPTLIRTIPFVASNALAASSIIFPGGLGVREALAAGFSAAANLPAAIGVTVSALDRVSMTSVYAVLASLLAINGRRNRVSETPVRLGSGPTT